MNFRLRMNHHFWIQCLVLLSVWALASTALAGGVGGGGLLGGGAGGMPWDQNVTSFRTSIRTVLCPAMIFIGIVMAGWEMFQEGEVKSLGRRGFVVMIAGGMGLGADVLITRMTSGGLVL